MKNTMRLLSLVIMALLLLSCNSLKTKSSNSEPSFSSEFVLATYYLEKIGEEDVSEMQLEMHIDPEQKRISGNAGCNRYGFTYSLKEEVLDLGYAMATKMYCEETMSIEDSFFRHMTKSDRFIVYKNKISFTNEENEVLVTAISKVEENE